MTDFDKSLILNGQLEDIRAIGSEIIDGRHRFERMTALNKSGKIKTPPRIVQVTPLNAWDYSEALNLARRQLTNAQRSSILISRSEAEDAEGIGAKYGNSAKKDKARGGQTGASPRTNRRARKVVKTGTPELIKEVKAGKVSLTKAESIAKLPKKKQAKAITEAKSPKPKKKSAVKTISPATAAHKLRTERISPMAKELLKLSKMVGPKPGPQYQAACNAINSLIDAVNRLGKRER
jgi:hypothetical protein